MLDKNYWNKRYSDNQTGWDIGHVSPQLKCFFDGLTDRRLKILIPGAGNGYEAEYLYQCGFTNTHILDFAEQALDAFAKRVPEFPVENMYRQNFFDHHSQYDLIIEQTFFCALHPSLRRAYCLKMSELLNAEGQLAGLFFNIPLNDDEPPFGGDAARYKALFSEFFDIIQMDKAENSIAPRNGNELFVRLRKLTLD